jgi:hypothetical protein
MCARCHACLRSMLVQQPLRADANAVDEDPARLHGNDTRHSPHDARSPARRRSLFF